MRDAPLRKTRLYAFNFAWLIGDTVLANLFGLLVLAVLARYLGPEEYGSYAYVFSIAALFSIAGHMGLEGLLTRELVKNPRSHSTILGTALALRFIGFFVGACLCMVYAFAVPLHSEVELYLFVAASLSIVFSPLPLVIENWFGSRVEARRSAPVKMFANVIGGTLRILCVVAGLGVVAVGFAQAFTVIFTGVLLFLVFIRNGGPTIVTWKYSSSLARQMLSEGWMIFVGAIFVIIYLKIDLAMLRWLVGGDEVGVYAVASRLSEMAYFLPISMAATLFPRLIDLREHSLELFNARLQGVFYILALAAYLIILSVFLVGPFVVPLIFGKAFTGSIAILQVHMLSMLFVFMFQAFSRWMIIEKFSLFSVYSQGAGALSNVLLNLLLIPKYGGLGAAYATLLSYVVATYFALLFTRKTQHIFMMMTRALIMPWKGVPIVYEMFPKMSGPK